MSADFHDVTRRPAEHEDVPAAQYLVLIPVYEDWESVRLLLPELDRVLTHARLSARVLLIDDGSVSPCSDRIVNSALSAIHRVDVLVLRRNVGHQRAVCVGIAAVVADAALSQSEAIVIMDGDGEDSPVDVPRLVEQHRSSELAVVFARRTRRSEGVVFRAFYLAYRQLHRLLTGIAVQIGNFSVLPMPLARRLAVSSELWNHYAAAVVHARLPIAMVDAPRGRRLHGESRMNFVALVSHGISAMSVFGDRIGVRALMATLALMVLLLGGIGAVLGIRFATSLAIPGWATTATGIIALLLLQSLLLSVLFVLLVHFGRAGSGFLPARDYVWYVEDRRPVWPRNE